jgi:hypothetical protein
MTFKESLFQGSKRRGFSEEQICTFINKAGTKCLPTFVTKQRKPKTNTSHASQLMTTDYLAFEVIKALRKTQMAESWIKDKEHEFKDMTRLQVLRSLSNLDSDNLQAVADQICVSVKTCKQHYES